MSRPALLRSAARVMATSSSFERISVAPRLVAAAQVRGAAMVKPAASFSTVRQPGGGLTGLSAFSAGRVGRIVVAAGGERDAKKQREEQSRGAGIRTEAYAAGCRIAHPGVRSWRTVAGLAD